MKVKSVERVSENGKKFLRITFEDGRVVKTLTYSNRYGDVISTLPDESPDTLFQA